MFRRQIGRAKNESPRDAVEFDERQSRRELIPGRDEYRSPTELLESTAEARSPDQFPKLTPASAPQSARSERCPAALSELQSEPQSRCGIFVKPDEVAEGHREVNIAGGAERINSQRILEVSDDHGKAERVETRVQKG
jgi:hypothetical protein